MSLVPRTAIPSNIVAGKITSHIVTIFDCTPIFASNNFTSTILITDLPMLLQQHGVICGAVNHPGDRGEYPMSKKTNENDIAEDEMNNAPVMEIAFWEDFIPLKVTTVSKHAAVRDDDTTKFVDLGYMHLILQKLMNSQIDDKDKTTTPREIKARVHTEFKRICG